MIILASQSGIRQQLLRHAGVSFTTVPIDFDEDKEKQRLGPLPARQLAQALAIGKARAASIQNPQALVIGADQTLEFDGEILHKASSLAEAAQQLKLLRNRQHVLHSAISVTQGESVMFETCTEAALRMRNFSDTFLENYLRHNASAVMGSVGCYHIEAHGIQLFQHVEGDHFTVMGLPLLPLLAFLREIGEMPQ